MSRVVIAPAALSQLEAIYDYSFERWGKERAGTYTDLLIDGIERIADRQVSWRTVPAEFGVDGYYFACGLHFIYWRTSSGPAVRIVAILHQKMHQQSRLRQALAEDS